ATMITASRLGSQELMLVNAVRTVRFDFVVAHIAGVAVFPVAAQGLGTLDHNQLVCAGSNLVHDSSHHSNAGEVLERRSLAPDDLERCNSDSLKVVNRAQPARAVRQAARRRAASVAVHVPDPFAVVRQISTQSCVLSPRQLASAASLELGVHLRK